MPQFITRHASRITGVLKGLDRFVFRGYLQRLCYRDGVMAFLSRQGALLKDFRAVAEKLTGMVREDAARLADKLQCPVKYLHSSAVRKEDVARDMLKGQPIKHGLASMLSCVEPCFTWQVHRCRKTQTQELRRRHAKCLHHYFYFRDPAFGWMHVRVQTWMPYAVQVCFNGREWLAKQLDREGLGYRRADNCFLWLEDVERTQQIMDRLVTLRWGPILDRLITRCSPTLGIIAEQALGTFHWSLHQCEFATDVMFRTPDHLAALYPRLARYAICDLGSRDTMRFLGKPLVTTYRGEVVTDYKHRPEGICVRHRAGANSIKMYDKQGAVLRIETTTNDPREFKRRRRAQGNPDSEFKPRPLRKGIADMKLRAEISSQANARYLESLAMVDSPRKLGDILGRVLQRAEIGGRKVRALAPCSKPDVELLRVLGRGDWIANGFRSRDVLPQLFPTLSTDDTSVRRKASAKLSRQLRLLRAHNVIRRIDGTHRYIVTKTGRTLITAVLSALNASLSKLRQSA